jgi:hypothetical protein
MTQAKLTKIQQILLAVIILIAIVIRFIHLGLHPLSESEAKLALQALATSKGLTIPWSGEAIYLAFTSGIFFLFDQTNFTSRLIPAIFGVLVVFSPLLFRRNLGNTITLLLSAFLSLDPAMVSLSRTAGGSIITLSVLTFVVYFLLNGKLILAGIACGLAVLSGAGIWSALVPFTIALIIWMILNKGQLNIHSQELDTVKAVVKEQSFKIAFVLSIVIIGTLWFILPRSLSALAGSITDYFQLLKDQGTLTFPLFLSGVLIYFPLGMIFGIWGGIRSLVGKSKPGIFLSIWFLVGMIMVLLAPGRDLTQLVWPIVPLYLLAAQELGRHFTSEQNELIPSIGIALLVFTIFIFLWLSFGKITYGGDQNELLLAVAAGIGILLVSGILIIFGWSAKIAGKGYLWGLLGVLAIYFFSTGWRVSGISNSEQTEMIGPARSMPQINLIDKTISELSNWTAGSSTGIQISIVGINSKALEWGLKDYPNSNFRLSIPVDEHPQVVIAAMDEPFNFQDQYRGQDFVFERSIDWQSFEPMNWISWLMYRKTQTTDTAIVLWARGDLFPGGAAIPAQ